MTNFTPEMIEKARAAKSAEELLALAKEIGAEEMTEESAKAYFEQLHPASGELSDDELDNVSGGGCETSDGYTIVTSEKQCFTGQYSPNYVIYYKGTAWEQSKWNNESDMGLRKLWFANCSGANRCGNCIHLEFKGGTGYCSKS